MKILSQAANRQHLDRHKTRSPKTSERCLPRCRKDVLKLAKRCLVIDKKNTLELSKGCPEAVKRAVIGRPYSLHGLDHVRCCVAISIVLPCNFIYFARQFNLFCSAI